MEDSTKRIIIICITVIFIFLTMASCDLIETHLHYTKGIVGDLLENDKK